MNPEEEEIQQIEQFEENEIDIESEESEEEEEVLNNGNNKNLKEEEEEVDRGKEICTNIDLGFISLFSEGNAKKSIFTSKVGGKAYWIESQKLPSNLICQSCESPLTLLVQLYTPGDETDDYLHRIIYVFCCKNDSCHIDPSKCFKVFRNQIKSENNFTEDGVKKEELENKKNICFVCGNYGGKVCGKCHSVYYCSKNHQVLHWGAGHKTRCGTQEKSEDYEKNFAKSQFKEFEIENEEEYLHEKDIEEARDDEENDDEYVEGEEFDDGQVEEKGKEVPQVEEVSEEKMKEFEKSHLRKDPFFLKFQKRIGIYPDQILRYARIEKNSICEPLWVSDEGKVSNNDIEACKNCGTKRTFEFQIMPQLLNHIGIDHSKENSIDWGTLLVYSCPNSCSVNVNSDSNNVTTYCEEILIRQNFSSIGVPLKDQEN